MWYVLCGVLFGYVGWYDVCIVYCVCGVCRVSYCVCVACRVVHVAWCVLWCVQCVLNSMFGVWCYVEVCAGCMLFCVRCVVNGVCRVHGVWCVDIVWYAVCASYVR